jgi:hypothetical protein
MPDDENVISSADELEEQEGDDAVADVGTELQLELTTPTEGPIPVGFEPEEGA